jgi:hypothetical protein
MKLQCEAAPSYSKCLVQLQIYHHPYDIKGPHVIVTKKVLSFLLGESVTRKQWKGQQGEASPVGSRARRPHRSLVAETGR